MMSQSVCGASAETGHVNGEVWRNFARRSTHRIDYVGSAVERDKKWPPSVSVNVETTAWLLQSITDLLRLTPVPHR